MIWTAFGGRVRVAIVAGIVGEVHEQVREALAQDENIIPSGAANVAVTHLRAQTVIHPEGHELLNGAFTASVDHFGAVCSDHTINADTLRLVLPNREDSAVNGPIRAPRGSRRGHLHHVPAGQIHGEDLHVVVVAFQPHDPLTVGRELRLFIMLRAVGQVCFTAIRQVNDMDVTLGGVGDLVACG